MRAYAKAEALCEAKARHPLAKPGPIDAKRAQKVNGRDPAMRAKLAAVWPSCHWDSHTRVQAHAVLTTANNPCSPVSSANTTKSRSTHWRKEAGSDDLKLCAPSHCPSSSAGTNSRKR